MKRAFLLALLLAACAHAPPTSTSTSTPTSTPTTTSRSTSPPAGTVEGDTSSADGVPIHYRSIGTGDRAVVLIHCWGCSSHYWDAVVPVLSRHVRVVTLDLAGHGASGKNRSMWTVHAFAEDVHAVVEKLGLARVVLVGHSMAGPIALETALLIPERVVGISPIDTMKRASSSMSEADRKKFFDRMRGDFPGVTEKLVRGFFPPNAPADVVERVVKDELAQDPTIAVPILDAAFSYPDADSLRRIHAPIHAIESDLSPTDATGNRTLAPQFEASIIPGTGHWPMLEAPARFAAMLDDVVTEWLDPTYVDAFVPSSDGVAIHYRAFGSPGGPPLLFTHGWCGDSHVWDGAMRAFSANHRVVALDLAGFGASGTQRKAFTITSFADDVRAVADAEKLDHVVLLGHSMSGDVILEATPKLGGRVQQLVPVDTLQNVDEPIDASLKARILGGMKADFAKGAGEFLGYMFGKNADPLLVTRAVDECTMVPRDVSIPVLDMILDAKSAAALSKVKISINAINGDLFPTKLDVEKKYAPQFDAVVLAGVGHWPMLQAPDRFVGELRNILDRLDPPAAH
jgi:pimeloyl-ACP methyl ester carboxylesterase